MSQRHSEYEPIPGDLFCTPSWVTSGLLRVETFPDPVWEPASGQGHMVRAISEDGYKAFGTDIATGVDFLEQSSAGPHRSIITNPPYSHGLADKFLRHALDLMEGNLGKIAMLFPLGFDTALRRHDLFRDHPAFSAKYVLTRRIRWENIEQKKNGPSTNFQWLVFDWSRLRLYGPDWKDNTEARPIVGYLP